jgi:excisionase family DNA binding protein
MASNCARDTKTARTADEPTAAPVYYTAKELAGLLRLADFRAIYKWVSSGKIPKWCVTKLGTKTLFKRESVEQWLAENTGT